MPKRVPCPVKLKRIKTIQESLSPQDAKTLRSIHRNVGKEHMSLSSRKEYYRLAARAVLQDIPLVDEYVKHRIAMLLNQAPEKDAIFSSHAESLAQILDTYPSLMTQTEKRA